MELNDAAVYLDQSHSLTREMLPHQEAEPRAMAMAIPKAKSSSRNACGVCVCVLRGTLRRFKRRLRTRANTTQRYAAGKKCEKGTNGKKCQEYHYLLLRENILLVVFILLLILLLALLPLSAVFGAPRLSRFVPF